ncbi:IPT/TIG domain-containing protein [Massilia sp. B-10]|nr:IPT/TIG domain-containing protein [Massilia sp. B-10]
MTWHAKSFQLSEFIRQFQIQLESSERFQVSDWLLDHLPHLIGPSITTFSPIHGAPGTMVTVKGHQFSATREENMVQVGGKLAAGGVGQSH